MKKFHGRGPVDAMPGSRVARPRLQLFFFSFRDSIAGRLDNWGFQIRGNGGGMEASTLHVTAGGWGV